MFYKVVKANSYFYVFPLKNLLPRKPKILMLVPHDRNNDCMRTRKEIKRTTKKGDNEGHDVLRMMILNIINITVVEHHRHHDDDDDDEDNDDDDEDDDDNVMTKMTT